jgi:hypothetical protein
MSTSDDTREILLAGLRQALQARVANVWNNVTLAGEQPPGPRFKEGITKAVDFYQQAVKAIEQMKI